MSVLEAYDLSIRFGGVQANLDVSVAVQEWEIVGVIGPNGAGKTTLFNLIQFPGGIGQQIRPVARWLSGHRFDMHDRGLKEVQITDVRA